MQSLPVYQFTREGFEKVKAEKEKLSRQRPEAVDELQKARELGDLSENGRYKAARAKLSFLDSRLRHLSILLRFGRIVKTEFDGTAQFGCKIKICDSESDSEREFQLVGAEEADPAQGRLSVNSPIGRALFGKKAGDEIEVEIPAGKARYKLLAVSC